MYFRYCCIGVLRRMCSATFPHRADLLSHMIADNRLSSERWIGLGAYLAPVHTMIVVVLETLVPLRRALLALIREPVHRHRLLHTQPVVRIAIHAIHWCVGHLVVRVHAIVHIVLDFYLELTSMLIRLSRGN